MKKACFARSIFLLLPWLAGCLSPVRHGALPLPALPSTWKAASDTACAVESAGCAPHGTRTMPSNEFDQTGTGRWWQAFNDASLDELIEQVLIQNPDLAVAAMRVHRARLEAELVGAETGVRASVTGGANAVRVLDADRVHALTGVNGTVSYEVDLWGKLAAQRDEAAWRAQASVADHEAARLALIGTTAKLYWQIGHLTESIALGEAGMADTRQVVAIADARRSAGATSRLEVAQARQQLALAQAEQTRRLKQRESKRNALALLLGGPPEQRGAEPMNPRATNVPGVAPDVPARVLARRPDLRAAEWRLRARWANVDVARASIYPTFTLTGELGTSSNALVRTLQNPVASLGIAMALPFVQWNTVRLKTALAESDFNEAAAAFRQTLYRALADVEDALTAKRQLDAEAVDRAHSLSDASLAATLALTRFELGATGAEPWIDAQRVRRAAEQDQADNRLARLENRIDLFLALGGG